MDDQEWRKAAILVPAGFRGLQAFRQFKLSEFKGIAQFVDDFILTSVSSQHRWQPRDNVAQCNLSLPHDVPARSCTCGFYGSYSSQIIYQPENLKNPLYCFAATRMYGENLPFAQNGLRSGGADVNGILFHPQSKHLPGVGALMRRLDKEGIYHTESATQFLRKFPDDSYKDILGFDPLERVGQLTKVIFDKLPYDNGCDHWMSFHYSSYFCRPLHPEMLVYRELHELRTDRRVALEVSIRPEYRPGGTHYRHPLLEVWPD